MEEAFSLGKKWEDLVKEAKKKDKKLKETKETFANVTKDDVT